MKLYETAEKYFQNSKKNHLIITGKIKSGKTTLLNHLISNTTQYKNIYGIKTELIEHKSVYMTNTKTGEKSKIGIKSSSALKQNMLPITEGFAVGIQAINYAITSQDKFFYIDEIGYIEKDYIPYLSKIWDLLNSKRVIAVARKADIPFINKICARNDTYLFDIDENC